MVLAKVIGFCFEGTDSLVRGTDMDRGHYNKGWSKIGTEVPPLGEVVLEMRFAGSDSQVLRCRRGAS